MPQEKLPVEKVNLEASLTKEQLTAIISWYFRNFLNKEPTRVSYHNNYSNEFNRADIQCTELDAPAPTRTVAQIKQAVKPGTIVID